MILITGATGFIGKEVTKLFISKPESVRLFVRNFKKAEKEFPGADIREGDLLENNNATAFRDIDTVIHLAGTVSYKKPWKELHRENVITTKNLVKAAKKANVKKIVFASSVGVYGYQKGVITEKNPIHPSNCYGRSKYFAEKEIVNSGLDYVCLRIGPVFGRGSMQWAKALKMFQKGFPIPKTENMTHLVHVSDVAEAFYLATKKGKGIYNIAGKERIKVMDLCHILCQDMGKNPRVIPFRVVKALVGAARKGGDFRSFTQDRNYDISKAMKELGYSPKAGLETEVKSMVKWYLEMK